MKSTQLRGHGLLHEGAPYDDGGKLRHSVFMTRTGPGRAKCSCGVMSEIVETLADRKRWHKDHKAAVVKAAKVQADIPK